MFSSDKSISGGGGFSQIDPATKCTQIMLLLKRELTPHSTRQPF